MFEKIVKILSMSSTLRTCTFCKNKTRIQVDPYSKEYSVTSKGYMCIKQQIYCDTRESSSYKTILRSYWALITASVEYRENFSAKTSIDSQHIN